MIPHRQAHGAAFSIGAPERMLIEHAILARRPAQQLNFLCVQETFNDDEAVFLVRTKILIADTTFGHGHISLFLRLQRTCEHRAVSSMQLSGVL